MNFIRNRSVRAALGAVVFAAALVVPAASVSAGSDEQAGGVVSVRGENGSFFPTAADGGTILLPDLRPRATFDHDPGDEGVVRLPTDHAMKLLTDEASIPVVVRRLGAPKDEDAFAMTLTQATFDPEGGFTATAVLADEADQDLQTEGIDDGTPPEELGAVELIALDSNAPVNADDRPIAPPQGSSSSSSDNSVFLKVTSSFPLGTSINFEPTPGDCVAKQSKFTWGQQNPPDSTTLDFEKVTSGGSCWIQPTVARWQVWIQPPGVDDYSKLWLYFEVNQLSPVSWNASCSTVNQPHRPKCDGSITFVGNEVTITVSPGS
jgi:hypothetical protein